VDLHLSSEWELTGVKHVNAEDRVQLVIENYTDSVTSLITWNLRQNIEDRSLEINDCSVSISKGVNSTLNYIKKSGIQYDLEYSFPLKFFASHENLDIQQNFYEGVVSEGKDMTVFRDYNSLGLSTTISELDRRFLEQFEDLRTTTLMKKAFPISKVNFRTQDGSNIFHFLVQDFKILKRFYHSYTKYVELFEDEDE
jgi:hypothetical protein